MRDKTRKPGAAPITVEAKSRLARFVCQEKPKDGAHWSARELSRRFGASRAAVNAVLRERNLKPRLVKRFQFSTDRDFIYKPQGVVGLYLDPPRERNSALR